MSEENRERPFNEEVHRSKQRAVIKSMGKMKAIQGVSELRTDEALRGLDVLLLQVKKPKVLKLAPGVVQHLLHLKDENEERQVQRLQIVEQKKNGRLFKGYLLYIKFSTEDQVDDAIKDLQPTWAKYESRCCKAKIKKGSSQ